MTARRTSDALARYRARRDFSKTGEPSGGASGLLGARFVVQRHWARREHFDFRLEVDGVLKSWAIAKGPSARPATRRLAVRTEDHPLDYADFEGVIPQGEYGGGVVQLWDRGQFEALSSDMAKAIEKGALKMRLHGERMRGDWALARLKPRDGDSRENWLLVKDRDDQAEADDTLALRYPTSVATGRTRDEIAAGKKPAKAATGRVTPDDARFIAPQLCDIRKTPPAGEDWLHEMKYDGYRLQLVLTGGKARLFTREGHDWTPRFEGLRKAGEKLEATSAIIDGEAVVFNDRGLSDFPALVEALRTRKGGVAFACFDLLRLNGEDLRELPLIERKTRLKRLLGGRKSALVYADHVIGKGAAFFEQAVQSGAEGIVSKRRAARYTSGRGPSWVKVKDRRRDDVTVIGWTPSDRGRAFASLVVARERKGALAYAGRVGTGFDAATQADLLARLAPLARTRPPDDVANIAAAPRKVTWVEPGLIIEIAMAGWTGDGQVRQGAFLGVREDRTAELERAQSRAATSPRRRAVTAEADLSRLSNPDKALYPDAGVTKRQVAAYLVKIAPRLLPHLDQRPVSFVRAPDGLGGERFFQRHPLRGMSRGLAPVQDGRSKRDYLRIEGVEGLVTCAQFGVLEIHGWGARADDMEKPDRLVFDLDPDEDLPFDAVKRGARQVRDVLKAAGLASFLMASGGKGLHVVAPLEPKEEWPVIEAFCAGLARAIAREDPAHWVAVMTKARRKGRIFLDYLRNKRAATAILPYSLRARPEASVAMPLEWRDLAKLTAANQFRMKDALSRRTDPWKGFFTLRQTIPKAALDLVCGERAGGRAGKRATSAR